MAKAYYEKLSDLLDEMKLADNIALPLEVKHFFSGAALYVDGVMCASWSPVGLAFKLPEKEVAELIDIGRAQPLRYFPKGHVKKGYALFEDPDVTRPERWKPYFLQAAQFNAN